MKHANADGSQRQGRGRTPTLVGEGHERARPPRSACGTGNPQRNGVGKDGVSLTIRRPRKVDVGPPGQGPGDDSLKSLGGAFNR